MFLAIGTMNIFQEPIKPCVEDLEDSLQNEIKLVEIIEDMSEASPDERLQGKIP